MIFFFDLQWLHFHLVQNLALQKRTYQPPEPFPTRKRTYPPPKLLSSSPPELPPPTNKKNDACTSTTPSTVSVSTSTHSLFTNEMDVSKRIALYNYFFIRGLITALTREENKEIEKSILNETIKEIWKIINKWLFFVLSIFFCRWRKKRWKVISLV